MIDCLIIGGGIIGLSIADELARQGVSVQVLDRRRSQRTASWAAAGILPPPIRRAKHDAMEQLRALSHELYPEWCARLSAESGLSVDYDPCGGVYLGRQPGETAALRASVSQWQADGVSMEELEPASIATFEPALAQVESIQCVYYLPDEALVRPPRLINALRACLESRGVTVADDVEVTRWEPTEQVHKVHTTSGVIEADQVCVTAGPWSHGVFQEFGLDLPVEPMRGQMLMWKFERPLIRHVVNEGPRYLLSRADGCLLAGSTVEEVGFDDSTTDEGIEELTEFASSLIPSLRETPPTATWAGLRPKSRDGFPLVGHVPQYRKLLVATGHYRSGIHLAPATARLVGQLIRSDTPDLDLLPFTPLRA